MPAEPSTPEGVVSAVLGLVGDGLTRLAVDGAPAHEAHALAASVAQARPGSVHVRAEGFWRPAGERFEHGRQDTLDWLQVWLDDTALEREVLVRSVERGEVVPALRDPVTDRSARATPVPASGVVVVSGSGLLGRGLSFDVTVHLQASAAALRRWLPPEEQWLVEPLTRYGEHSRPGDTADLVVRVEDPRRPALVRRADRH